MNANAPPADPTPAGFSLSAEVMIPVAIAGLTLLGYGGAFLFELGYCRHLGVPGRLIDVPWGGAILFGLGLAALFAASLMCISQVASTSRITEAALIGMVVLVSGMLAAASWSPLPAIIAIIAPIFVLWLTPIARKRWGGKAVDKRPSRLEDVSVLLCVTVTVAATAFYAGAAFARNQESFIVIDENFLLATTGGGELVFCGFDSGDPAALDGRLKIVPIADAGELQMEWRRIGPLDRVKHEKELPRSPY